MLSGKLTVVGKDIIFIELGPERPLRVEVWFEEDAGLAIPCNPSHHHKLNWQIHRRYHEAHKKHLHHLIVSWEVAGVKTVCWRAHY